MTTTGVCSCSQDCNSPGKHPMTTNGLDSATVNEDHIQAYWKQRPYANIGIATGGISGFDVIDIDPRHGGDDTWAALERKHGGFPETVEALTGGGGRHILVAYGGDVYSRADVFDGVDVKSDGGYIVAPPSNHASGRSYAWDIGVELDAPLAIGATWAGWANLLDQFTAAADVIPALSPKLTVAPIGAVAAVGDNAGQPISEGSRNVTLMRCAGRLRAQGMELEAMVVSLRGYNAQFFSPPLADSEVMTVAKSACRYERGTPLAEMFANIPTAVDPSEPTEPTEPNEPADEPDEPAASDTVIAHPHTDAGNRDRLVRRFGSQIMYVPQHGWYYWNKTRWAIDDFNMLQEMAIDMARTIRHDEAGLVIDAKGVDKSLNWSLQSENKSRLKNAVDLATSADGVPRSVDDLDTHPYLFNALNKTIDLLTGAAIDFDPEHRLTQMSRMPYSPFADCARWRRFIVEIMAGNHALARHLQKLLGLCISGDMSAEAMVILFGDGANGKSVMLEVLQYLLGDYAKTAPAQTFLESNNGGEIRNDLAMLRGSRMVSVSETNKGQYLDESLIKRLSSGDRETARFLHKEYFEFTPQYKVLMATNNKPEIKGASHGTWRRIHLIEFGVKFGEPGHPVAENKEALVAEMKAEAPGILNWLLDGFGMYREEGLTPPDAVVEATRSYREDMDPLLEFFDDCCVIGDDVTCIVADAAEAYNAYTNADLSSRAFGRKMADHGYRSRRVSGGTIRVYDGISLNEHGQTLLSRNNRGFNQ